MYAAELNVVLTNVLSNAIKAAATAGADSRLVAIRAVQSDDLIVWLSNTGTVVELEDAERWFAPIQLSTTDVDPVLGQGLGLGLPLTRRIVEDYGGTIRFAEPDPGFSTTIEIRLPND